MSKYLHLIPEKNIDKMKIGDKLLFMGLPIEIIELGNLVYKERVKFYIDGIMYTTNKIDLSYIDQLNDSMTILDNHQYKSGDDVIVDNVNCIIINIITDEHNNIKGLLYNYIEDIFYVVNLHNTIIKYSRKHKIKKYLNA